MSQMMSYGYHVPLMGCVGGGFSRTHKPGLVILNALSTPRLAKSSLLLLISEKQGETEKLSWIIEGGEKGRWGHSAAWYPRWNPGPKKDIHRKTGEISSSPGTHWVFWL